jgi:hypothetical protein
LRCRAKALSSFGVFLVFLMKPCRRTISFSYTKNNVRAIRVGKVLRISWMPEPMLRTSGIPSGQRNCTVMISIPIIFLSAFGKSCNHSRTGSRPVSVRKKTAGNNRGTWMTVSFLIHPTSKKYALFYANCSASSDKKWRVFGENCISALAR